jgi:type I restriction enzyme S subunit
MESLALMPRYEAYKDSGVEWLGDIPSSWELKPGFVAFRESKSNNKGMKENTVLSLSYGHIVVKPEEKLVGLVPESFETYQLVEPDDIIVRCTDLQNDKVSLRIGLAKNKGIITNAYLNLRVKNGFDARFLHYYLHALDTTKVLYKFGSGLRQNLSFLDFKRLPIFEIPEDTQKLIANYLEKKTAQVDDAIAIKEQQISLLKERKQIIIQQVVTRGLDPNVPMKDSGVDWIGKIPEHWGIVPGFTVFKEGKDSNKGMIESQVLSLSYGNIIVKPEEKLVGLVPESFETYQIALPGDIIIRCTDLQNDKTSLRTGIVRNKGIITSAYLNLRLKTEHSPEFMHYFLHVLDVTKAIYRFGSGLRQNLSYQDFKHMRILMPPKAEQIEIVNYINNRVEVAESSIDLIKNQIEKLKEYKTTLINSAVTGKIKITPEMVEQ